MFISTERLNVLKALKKIYIFYIYFISEKYFILCVTLCSRHECYGENHRPADQHPGPDAGGTDHGVRLPFHGLRFHLGLEPLLHVSRVLPPVEGVPENSSAGHQGGTERLQQPGDEAAQRSER